jgi:stage III sporulation protein SpoIIIAA
VSPNLTAVIDDLDTLISLLPPDVARAVNGLNGHRKGIVEIVMDLGREPIARLEEGDLVIVEREIEATDLHGVVERLGAFGSDNRAGISGTLHRISALRNRTSSIVGLTCRVGRAVPGAAEIIADEIRSGKSILVLGRPGAGKTTVLREAARLAAEERRVIVVDTSNEIAGDGDIPHSGIGRARRIQVPRVVDQHAVMIEAVENHMPQVIVIDEIGTEEEAKASRTIAERGVQLIATAHGVDLAGLLLNPTLSDLVGGMETVTIGDDEARRRGTAKTITERKSPPTFDIVVELIGHANVAIFTNTAAAVDAMLRGEFAGAEERLVQDGELIARFRKSWGDPSRFAHDERDLWGPAPEREIWPITPFDRRGKAAGGGERRGKRYEERRGRKRA